MLVVLQTKSLHGRAKRIQLRAHQLAKFGRSEWADYSFSNDRVMADMHFEVRCVPEGCQVTTLDKDAVTLVNGKEIAGTTFVEDGDEITAGTTVLSVHIDGHHAKVAPTEKEAPKAEAEPAAIEVVPSAGAVSLVATCAFLDMPKDVQACAEETPAPEDMIQRLSDNEQYLDAIRLRAFLLPNREAVWWACNSAREELAGELEADQEASLQAALDWALEPTEERRREAETASNGVRNQGVGGMLALAAFWCEGSIGPPDGPPVPADERLVCQGITAALATGAYVGNPELAPTRLRKFLDNGKLVANGEMPIPS